MITGRRSHLAARRQGLSSDADAGVGQRRPLRQPGQGPRPQRTTRRRGRRPGGSPILAPRAHV